MNHPNYKHRTFISGSNKLIDFDSMDLADCISLSVEQAESILSQMQLQYLGDRDKASDPDNFSTLEVIRKELLDIKTVVNWYFENNKGVKNHE